jgi:hypothetical protein
MTGAVGLLDMGLEAGTRLDPLVVPAGARRHRRRRGVRLAGTRDLYLTKRSNAPCRHSAGRVCIGAIDRRGQPTATPSAA